MKKYDGMIRNELLDELKILPAEKESGRAEEALGSSEEFLQLAQQAGGIGMFERNIATGETRWTTQLEQLYGLQPGEFGGDFKVWERFVHPDDLPAAKAAISKGVEERADFQTEYRIIRPDQSVRWMAARGKVLCDEQGEPKRAIGVNIDITERKRSEVELRRAKDELEKRVAERTAELEVQNRKLRETYHELEMSRDRYSNLYNFAPLGYITLDDEGVVRNINMTGAILLEVERAELIYKPFVNWLETEECRTFLDHLRRCRKGTGCVKSELRIAPKPGRTQYIELFSVPLQDTEGHESLYRTAITDVTERKLADERIMRLNRLYTVLSATDKAIVRATDRETLFSEICRVAVEYGGFRLVWIGLVQEETGLVQPVAAAGMAPGYLDDMHISIRDEPAGQGQVGSAIRAGSNAVFNDFLHDPRILPWQERALAKGFLAAAAIVLKLNGTVIGTLTLYAGERDFFDAQMVELLQQMAADISFALDNLDREARRREAETKYRALFEESKDVIYIIAASKQLVDINFAGLELFGYTKEELLSLDIGSDLFFDPHERESFGKKLFARGYVRDYEVRMKKKNGKELAVLVSGSIIRNGRGEITGYRGIIHDITKRKQLEQQLLQAQKMESIGLLAGGVAHDFNNLLTVISGYGQIAQENFAASDEMLGMCIGQIMSATGRAIELTRSLLAFGRKQIINPQPVDVNDIVINLSKLLTRLIGEDIEFSTTLAGGQLTVLADSGQIDQVLINLATNARDAMPTGGKLHIRTERVELDGEAALLHDLDRGGAYALISVTDTGLGMDLQTKERIFEPFFTTKAAGMGTGLGLSINYGIIKQHNGAITVKSEPNLGTTFTIYLILADEEVGKLQEQEDTPLPYGTETLLVAEDEEIVSMYLKKVLAMSGYTVIAARDGAEAIEQYRDNQQKIALVLCDVVMPKKNGKEVCEEIRAMNPEAKILFISGYNDEIIHKKGILLENTNFLMKPVSREKLLLKLREILDATDERKPSP
jgi:PAS domain S-box-containing protein